MAKTHDPCRKQLLTTVAPVNRDGWLSKDAKSVRVVQAAQTMPIFNVSFALVDAAMGAMLRNPDADIVQRQAACYSISQCAPICPTLQHNLAMLLQSDPKPSDTSREQDMEYWCGNYMTELKRRNMQEKRQKRLQETAESKRREAASTSSTHVASAKRIPMTESDQESEASGSDGSDSNYDVASDDNEDDDDDDSDDDDRGRATSKKRRPLPPPKKAQPKLTAVAAPASHKATATSYASATTTTTALAPRRMPALNVAASAKREPAGRKLELDDFSMHKGSVDASQPWNVSDTQAPFRLLTNNFSECMTKLQQRMGLNDDVRIGISNICIRGAPPALQFVLQALSARPDANPQSGHAQGMEEFANLEMASTRHLPEIITDAKNGSSSARKFFSEGDALLPLGRPTTQPRPEQTDPNGQWWFSLARLASLYLDLGRVRKNANGKLDLTELTCWSLFTYLSPDALGSGSGQDHTLQFDLVVTPHVRWKNSFLAAPLRMKTPWDQRSVFMALIRSAMRRNERKRAKFGFLLSHHAPHGVPPPTPESPSSYALVVEPSTSAADQIPYCNSLIVMGVAPGAHFTTAFVRKLASFSADRLPMLPWLSCADASSMSISTPRGSAVWRYRTNKPVVSKALAAKAKEMEHMSADELRASEEAVLYAANASVRHWCWMWRAEALAKGVSPPPPERADWWPELLRDICKNTPALEYGGDPEMFRAMPPWINLPWFSRRSIPPLLSINGNTVAPTPHQMSQTACKRGPGKKDGPANDKWGKHGFMLTADGELDDVVVSASASVAAVSADASSAPAPAAQATSIPSAVVSRKPTTSTSVAAKATTRITPSPVPLTIGGDTRVALYTIDEADAEEELLPDASQAAFKSISFASAYTSCMALLPVNKCLWLPRLYDASDTSHVVLFMRHRWGEPCAALLLPRSGDLKDAQWRTLLDVSGISVHRESSLRACYLAPSMRDAHVLWLYMQPMLDVWRDACVAEKELEMSPPEDFAL